MRVVVWLAAVFLVGGASAQEAKPEAEPKRGVVEGVVLNEITKEPIRRAEVRLFKQGEVVQFSAGSLAPAAPGAFAAVTDAGGRFRIENVEEGTYRVMYQRAGFMPARSGGTGTMTAPGTAMVRVGEGLETRSLRFTLLPQAVLSGRVFDEEGEPVQGVFVSVMTQRYARGRRHWMASGGQQTNDRGEYRIPNVGPGKVLVMVQGGRGFGGGPPAPHVPGQPEMGYVATYYPSALEPGEAAPVEVTAGAELANLDITLRRAPVYRIRGRALDVDGKPLNMFSITVAPRDGYPAGPGMSGGVGNRPDGTFEVANVRPGQWNLVVQHMTGGPGTRMVASVPVDVSNADVEGVVVRMSVGFDVPGRVEIQGPGEKPALNQVRVSLPPADSLVSFGGSMPATAKEDGSFTLTSVMPGRYYVMAYGGGPMMNLYLASIQVGGQEYYAKPLDLSAGPPGPLRIIFRTDPASLRGTVDMGSFKREESGAMPVAVLLPAELELRGSMFSAPRTVPVDQAGGFQFTGLRPGEYLAWAFDEAVPGALEDPEVLQKVIENASKVRVKAGETASLQLKMSVFPRD